MKKILLYDKNNILREKSDDSRILYDLFTKKE